jgi:HB1, ASXL, restriction endonuclease HTH domain
MSTLAVVEAILREAAVPLSVREIVERAGDALPTKSKTPDTVVARDLSMDIKRKSDASLFVRTSPGRYAMRDQQPAAAPMPVAVPVSDSNVAIAPVGPSGPSVPNIAASVAEAAASPTSMVGQSLPHDRNGVRPAPAKPVVKSQSNSEDTPMSA